MVQHMPLYPPEKLFPGSEKWDFGSTEKHLFHISCAIVEQ